MTSIIAFLMRCLGIGKIIATWLTSPQGRLVLDWASRVIPIIKKVGSDDTLKNNQRFQIACNEVEQAMKAAGVDPNLITVGAIRKIVETAHGAWQQSTPGAS